MTMPSVDPSVPDEALPAPGFPIRTLVIASICGVLWHVLLLVFGFYCFEPPKPVEQPKKPQEVAAGIIATETGPNVQVWYRWDALWFVHLSRFGYVLETGHDDLIEQSNLAFTPGLAFVASMAGRFLDDPWCWLLGFEAIAAWLATLGLGAVSWRLTQSRTALVWSIVAFVAWPWWFFMAAPYQEAAGAALTFWAMYAGISGRVVPGFVCAALASAFRLNSVGLFGGWIAGAGLEFLRNRDRPLQVRRMIIGSGALLGWGLLLAFFQYRFGDAGLGVKIQSAWGRQPPHLTGIFESLAAPLLHRMTGTEWLDWAAAWTVLAAIPIVYRKFGIVWASSLVGLVFQALSTGRVLSFGRFSLMACPFFVIAGAIAERRPRLAKVVCTFCFAAQLGLAWRYGHDLFAG